jgi:hypothetical protein
MPRRKNDPTTFRAHMKSHATLIAALKHEMGTKWSGIAGYLAADPIFGRDGEPRSETLFKETWGRLKKDGELDLDWSAVKSVAAECRKGFILGDAKAMLSVLTSLNAKTAPAVSVVVRQDQAPEKTTNAATTSPENNRPPATTPKVETPAGKKTTPETIKVEIESADIAPSVFGETMDAKLLQKRDEAFADLKRGGHVKKEDLLELGLCDDIAEKLSKRPQDPAQLLQKMTFLYPADESDIDFSCVLNQPESRRFALARLLGEASTFDEAKRLFGQERQAGQ